MNCYNVNSHLRWEFFIAYPILSLMVNAKELFEFKYLQY
ncbi:hypothetical protein HNP37_003614 [Flavobacterium nitrogenifigens]|uniref:Uncharacterized protein n=2 Tax=Flavobacterium TaxID=237 RepID=A0A7W7N9J5_9FLAO|nr:hypothetical protein [Flavobacterium nitrogenifigens]MBB6388656.1 hypothetical protein [Flavobacterium notoginsengisoli]